MSRPSGISSGASGRTSMERSSAFLLLVVPASLPQAVSPSTITRERLRQRTRVIIDFIFILIRPFFSVFSCCAVLRQGCEGIAGVMLRGSKGCAAGKRTEKRSAASARRGKARKVPPFPFRRDTPQRTTKAARRNSDNSATLLRLESKYSKTHILSPSFDLIFNKICV